MSCSSGFVFHYDERGGGEMRGLPWVECAPAPAEVDIVDGAVLVLSPWAVRNLRFDETLTLGHGFDVDFCLQARCAGRKVVTIDFSVIEQRPLKIIGDVAMWTEAHADFARKWTGNIPGQPPVDDYEALARRLEAEREAARSMAYFRRLSQDARIELYEREYQAALQTLSWKLTEPLRRVNLWRNSRRQTAED